MIKSIKIKIGIIITVIIFIILNTISLNTIFAQSTSSPYENDKLSIYEVEKLYHKRINDLFNAKLKLLNAGEKGGGVSKAPEGDECPENNYSTFCLATAAAKEYEQLKSALNKRKQVVEIGNNPNPTLEEVSMQAFSKSTEIELELSRSKSALDAALQNYNELRIAYPMHLQYLEVIKSLKDYNKKLTNLRKEVEKLPGKFIDATTAQCK